MWWQCVHSSPFIVCNWFIEPPPLLKYVISTHILLSIVLTLYIENMKTEQKLPSTGFLSFDKKEQRIKINEPDEEFRRLDLPEWLKIFLSEDGLVDTRDDHSRWLPWWRSLLQKAWIIHIKWPYFNIKWEQFFFSLLLSLCSRIKLYSL